MSSGKTNEASQAQPEAPKRTNFLSIPHIELHVENPLGKTVTIDATPTDCLMDIRQFLLETPDSCYFTCYQLQHEGKMINDFAELSEYPELKEGKINQLKMVPGFYDEQSARTHVRRLREIIVNPPVRITQKTNPYVSDKTAEAKTGKRSGKNKKKKGEGKNIEDSMVFNMTSYTKTEKKEAVPEVVRNINFSAWNPPPGNRRLRGDLMYLEVKSLEKNTLHITCSVAGFFLNSSTRDRFNPLPAKTDYKSHTLVELLKKASHSFSSKFSSLMNRKMTRHPYEVMPRPYPIHEWMAPTPTHAYDWNRAEDSLLTTYGMEGGRGVLRDWNEEYQCCHEMPRETLGDRILYNRTKYRVYHDFRDAAVKGACAVVNGNIPPINPMDEERAWVYLYNKIFFSLTIDGRDSYKDIGGDKVSHCNASHDLLGITYFEKADVKELYTLATLTVDYRGHRVMAQSIIPGIFHLDQASTHVYGTMDNSDSIKCSPDFHKLILKAADKLHIKEHKVVDVKGNTVTLASCVETKGILGSDRRHYVLDLTRMFPRDSNFPKYENNPTALLRPELVAHYCCRKAFTQVVAENKKKQEKAKKEAESKGKEGKGVPKENSTEAGAAAAVPTAAAAVGAAKEDADVKTENPADEGKVVAPETKKPVITPEEQMAAAKAALANRLAAQQETNTNYIKAMAGIKFNPDVLCNVTMPDKDEEKKDLGEVVAASTFLLNHIIPKLVAKDFRTLKDSPLDGTSLTKVMHKNGVNVRYLGHMAAMSTKLNMPHIAQLCTQEMIVRAAKHLLNGMLRDVKPDLQETQANWFLAPCIRKFLNSFFGPNCAGKGMEEDQLNAAVKVLEMQAKTDNDQEKQLPRSKRSKRKRNKKNSVVVKLKNGRNAPIDPLHPANLWVAIRSSIQKKFNCRLPMNMDFTARRKLCMLRSLCKKVGIQLACRKYDFDSKGDIFAVEDILDLFPIVKTIELNSKDAAEYLDHGKMYLGQGRLQLAYAKLHDAQGILHQTYGPMHEQSAQCYALIALVCYKAHDLMQAVEMQQKALLVYERVLGLDHSETAYAHSTMALFLHSIGQPKHAMTHIKRSLFLLELMCGPNHPDVAAAHINMAMIYQESGQMKKALEHLYQAKARWTMVLGAKHSQIGLCDHTIAVAHGMVGNFREAIKYEKSSKNLYTSALGEKNGRVVESVMWLQWFIKNAVQVEKGEFKSGIFPVHPQLSPFVWVSLQKLVPVRGLNNNDLVQLIKVSRRNKQLAAAVAAQKAKAAAAAAAETATSKDAGATNASARKKEKRKQKRKLQKQRAKAEKEAAEKESNAKAGAA